MLSCRRRGVSCYSLGLSMKLRQLRRFMLTDCIFRYLEASAPSLEVTSRATRHSYAQRGGTVVHDAVIPKLTMHSAFAVVHSCYCTLSHNMNSHRCMMYSSSIVSSVLHNQSKPQTTAPTSVVAGCSLQAGEHRPVARNTTSKMFSLYFQYSDGLPVDGQLCAVQHARFASIAIKYTWSALVLGARLRRAAGAQNRVTHSLHIAPEPRHRV